MDQQKLRLMFTGGGSGGPTTPLLGLAETLKDHEEYSMEFLFLGTSRGPERRMVEEFGMPYQAIPAGKLRRYWDWKNLSDPFLVLVGFFYGVFYLLKFRPQIVISAGSFASVPVAWASMILRVPHLILQMDVRPGLANRLMKPCCNAAAFYFESTLNTFSGIQKREVVGPVVRSNILNSDPKRAEAEWGLDPEKPLLTVTGGGQGAGQLNRLVELWLPVWLQNWQVVHLTGKGHTGENKVHPDYHPLEFVEHGMGDLLARSDLVITRAGMGILGELSVLAKDALVIPMAGTHQEINMDALVKKDSVFQANPDLFKEPIDEKWKQFFNNFKPGPMGEKLHQVWSGPGNQALSTMVLSCIEKNLRN